VYVKSLAKAWVRDFHSYLDECKGNKILADCRAADWFFRPTNGMSEGAFENYLFVKLAGRKTKNLM